MISLFTLSVEDRGFDLRTGQTKDYNNGMCCFSDKHAALFRERIKTGWLGIRIICPSEATYLSADYCFSELAL